MSDAVQTKKRPGRPKKTQEEPSPTTVVNEIIAPQPVIKRVRKTAKPAETPSVTEVIKQEEDKPTAPKELCATTPTAAKPTCPICCEHFTSQLRKPICCPKCSTETCAVCTKRFLLDLIVDPHCMNCNFGWTRSFLNDSLSHAFMNGDWSEHRQQVLWRREEAYLPEAQLVAERITKGRTLRKELAPIDARRTKILKELANVEAEYNSIMRRIQRLEAGEDDSVATTAQQETQKKERKEFVRHCPHDNCKGFLSSAWKCGLCENYTCKDCLVVRGKDRDAAHTCNKDDLATAQLIAKDTKFCPNPQCGIGIMRTEGCSQMFCVSCKTAFDWNTMRIITSGHIHNPHYFAYMQANGGQANRPAGDMLCGGLPPPSVVQPPRGVPKHTWNDNAESIYRAIGHMFDVIGPRYQAHIREEDNRDYRVKYLLNDMSKAEIERILVIQERRRERERSIREVIDTFGNIGAEIFRRFAADFPAQKVRTEENWAPYYKELEGLRNYCNDEFMKISKHYKVVVPIIVQRITKYDPKGNHQISWHIETENANRFTERLDNTLSVETAKKEYEQTVKKVDELTFGKTLADLINYIDNPESVRDTTKLLGDGYNAYNEAVKLKDSIPIDEKAALDKLNIKISYYLVYYNQAWCNNKLDSKIIQVAGINMRPVTRYSMTEVEQLINTFWNMVIVSGAIHPRIPDALLLLTELLNKCSAEIPNDIVNSRRSPWKDKFPALLTFKYDEETQKKTKMQHIEAYNNLLK